MFVRQLVTVRRTGSGRFCYDNICPIIIPHGNFGWIIIISVGIQTMKERRISKKLNGTSYREDVASCLPGTIRGF